VIGFADLYSRDATRAAAFLVDVLELSAVDEGIEGPGDYRLLISAAGPVAGVVDMSAVMPTENASYWVPHFRVVDLDDTVARLVDLGARVRIPVTDSSLGPFAVLTDPPPGNCERDRRARRRQRAPDTHAIRNQPVCSNRTRSRWPAPKMRLVRTDDSSFTLNTPETKERDMPEAMLPAVLLAGYSERGRSEHCVRTH
jgi:predicted enzyme related to lactoylglutathione lyase